MIRTVLARPVVIRHVIRSEVALRGVMLKFGQNMSKTWYSTEGATRKITPSPFASPKATPEKVVTATEVPQEDIDDFNITKLVNGETNLRLAITKRARDKLMKIAEEDKNPKSALKIGVESGGCHGFQYNLTICDVDKELAEDDELLVFRREDGVNAQVVIDDSSLEILQDSKIDYTKELIGSSFKIVDSPYTSTTCGCGASFDFDFEKLEKKKEKNQH